MLPAGAPFLNGQAPRSCKESRRGSFSRVGLNDFQSPSPSFQPWSCFRIIIHTLERCSFCVHQLNQAQVDQRALHLGFNHCIRPDASQGGDGDVSECRLMGPEVDTGFGFTFQDVET